MYMKGICRRCRKVYYGWALLEAKHRFCTCGGRLKITRLD